MQESPDPPKTGVNPKEHNLWFYSGKKMGKAKQILSSYWFECQKVSFKNSLFLFGFLLNTVVKVDQTIVRLLLTQFRKC